eukprot:6476925-Amphidinium_carterae.1
MVRAARGRGWSTVTVQFVNSTQPQGSWAQTESPPVCGASLRGLAPTLKLNTPTNHPRLMDSSC